MALAQRRKRYREVLELLGAWELFTRIPRRYQESLCMCKFPDPVLEFDPGWEKDPEFPTLRRTLEQGFREARLDLEAGTISVRDFFAIFAGLLVVLGNSYGDRTLPLEFQAFMRVLLPVLEDAYDPLLAEVWNVWHRALVVPLVRHCRLDRRMGCVAFRAEHKDNGKSGVHAIVRVTEPQVRYETIDGVRRPLYRVGTSNEWTNVAWLSWNGEHLNRARDREYPVYAQSHALRQLHDRLNLPSVAPYLEHWMYASLKEPRIVQRHRSHLLVEYRVQQDRLGYLVVTAHEDFVLVRTFKFLTMEHTPEAQLLRQRLRLTRCEIDWLGLSQLSAFTETDLRDDPELRALLEDCGCGHLFELAEMEDCAPEPKAFAQEMRRYLRLAA